MAMGQLTTSPVTAKGNALRKCLAGAICSKLNTRPLSSEGTLSWTKVLAKGQNNPVLMVPTKKNSIQDSQYQGDHANELAWGVPLHLSHRSLNGLVEYFKSHPALVPPALERPGEMDLFGCKITLIETAGLEERVA